jgi:hypothetical protein
LSPTISPDKESVIGPFDKRQAIDQLRRAVHGDTLTYSEQVADALFDCGLDVDGLNELCLGLRPDECYKVRPGDSWSGWHYYFKVTIEGRRFFFKFCITPRGAIAITSLRPLDKRRGGRRR